MKNDNKMFENLDEIKKIGYQFSDLLEQNDLQEYAKLMNYHWKIKQKRSKGMTNKKINFVYNQALKNGAIGGKLVGAGGGGFLLFYSKDKIKLRKKMKSFNLQELDFKIDFEGTKLL
jgi:D-glycero-alpha-D-manno-heptose-7-phosphate kinase